jgi:CheY-like chemotaxis protein
MMNELRYAVVCVDDDPLILQVLSFQLEKIIDKKCTLLEYFTDPVEALSNIEELIRERLDIIFIIVDYQMPNMNGAQLIRALKEKYPNLACVMLSGQANSVQVTELENDKLLSEFISKPWDEATLFNALEPIIRGKAS